MARQFPLSGTPEPFADGVQPQRAQRHAQPGHGDDGPAETMTDEERAAVRRGLDDWRAGHLASADEMQAIFRRLGR